MTNFIHLQTCFDDHKYYAELAFREVNGERPSGAVFRLYVELADTYLRRARSIIHG